VTREARREAGFSLVEALVGLAILSLVLTLSLFALFRLAPAERRLAARLEAERAAEAVLESVRAGAMPLLPGRTEVPALAPPRPAAERLRGSIEVGRTEVRGLYEVAVVMRYRVQGAARSIVLTTMVWQPEADLR
jgi:type II secretory pathway pseudopilin PulG